MKKKVFIHQLCVTEYLAQYETGKDNVADIQPLTQFGLVVLYADGTKSVFQNMPFEYHEIKEE